MTGKVLVAGHASERDVTGLGMQHAVEQLTAHVHAGADAGADRDIDHVVEPLAGAVHDLAQAGAVHVGVISAGYGKATLHLAKEVVTTPRELGRLQNMAVLRRLGIDRRGPKRRDSQRGDSPCSQTSQSWREPYARAPP